MTKTVQPAATRALARRSWVLKREVIDGEKAEEARKKIARSASKSLRQKSKSQGGQSPDIIVPPTTPAA